MATFKCRNELTATIVRILEFSSGMCCFPPMVGQRPHQFVQGPFSLVEPGIGDLRSRPVAPQSVCLVHEEVHSDDVVLLKQVVEATESRCLRLNDQNFPARHNEGDVFATHRPLQTFDVKIIRVSGRSFYTSFQWSGIHKFCSTDSRLTSFFVPAQNFRIGLRLVRGSAACRTLLAFPANSIALIFLSHTWKAPVVVKTDRNHYLRRFETNLYRFERPSKTHPESSSSFTRSYALKLSAQR